MISDQLLSLVRCPDCRGGLDAERTSVTSTPSALICVQCGRRYPVRDASYLDLRPSAQFRETTKYVDPALHADHRHERVSPPLLTAAIRNDMLRAFLAPSAADRVVDLGCGSGRSLVWNRGAGGYELGIDVTPHFALEARAEVDLVVADLRRLPLPDGAFTKAFSLDVAEHLSRESLTAVLQEARRILVPGGALFLYTHVRRNSPLALGVKAVNRIAHGLEQLGLLSLRQERLRKSDHINPLADLEDFKRVTSDAGFRLARIRYYTPLIGSFIENIIVRLAEGVLARRASGGTRTSDEVEPLRAARLDAKRRIAERGPVWAGLRALTWLMKLDVWLFGRVRTGPLFALLIKDTRDPD
jgi:SAM-dependent methyltransferase